jgi:thioesterase domain-containing protein
MHGDSSNAFLPRYLGLDQPFYGLEHQSQDGTRALYTRVETIATHYLEEIRPVQPQGPYFLGGYSFGSIGAFEAAQQLKRQGEEVALLVLLDPRIFTSGTASPSLVPHATDGLTHVNRFCDTIRRHWRHLAALEFQEKLAYILVRVKGKITESKMLKKVLSKVYVSLGHHLPPSLRSPYILDIYRKATHDYSPQSYQGRVILFKSETCSSDPLLDWQKLIVGELEMHELPGEHLDMIKEQYIPVWAETLQACLHKAQSNVALST